MELALRRTDVGLELLLLDRPSQTFLRLLLIVCEEYSSPFSYFRQR